MMLERFERVEGVGLLHAASNGARHKLSRLSLLYAENGRGKSTLSDILSSCGSGDDAGMLDRQTIDGSNTPYVKLQFEHGHGVEYRDGCWSELRPEVSVFDANFVEGHVHSGGEVTPQQRRNLLDFALGSSAIAARDKERSAATAQAEAAASIRELTASLEGHAGSLDLSVFRSMPKIEDLDQKITRIEERKRALGQVESIRARSEPELFDHPHLDVASIFDVLNRTLDDVHDDAERLVEDHLHDAPPRLGQWVREGQAFDDGTQCPYCGQSTASLDLIRAYRAHFNRAYQELQGAIQSCATAATIATADGVVEDWHRHGEAVRDRSTAWSEELDLADALALEDEDLARDTLANLSDLLIGLFARKSTAPAEAIGAPEEKLEAERLWHQFVEVVDTRNEIVAANNQLIAEYKAALDAENPERIEHELARLLAVRLRHTDEVEELDKRLRSAEEHRRDAERTTRQAREELRSVMATTLDRYRVAINAHLKNLGAAFRIDKIETNFTGGTPRTDYGIALRGHAIKLNGGRPSFAVALSEGDKRTMAFAFFAASLLGDPSLAEKIVVVDDPMTSLDRSRRSYTITVLRDIARSAKQLIVLAHDARFLRDLRDSARRLDEQITATVLGLTRTTGEYSDFSAVDLERECESTFFANYRLVSEYVAGQTTNHREVAVALRTVLEGHIHRRFPGLIGTELTLGRAISQLADSEPPSPLVHAQGVVPEMREVNDFASKFHHDTNPDYARQPADPAEVATWAGRILDIIHGAPVS